MNITKKYQIIYLKYENINFSILALIIGLQGASLILSKQSFIYMGIHAPQKTNSFLASCQARNFYLANEKDGQQCTQ